MILRCTSRWLFVSLLLGTVSCGGSVPTTTSEDSYRVNNRGVALLEQFDYEGAAEVFSEALIDDPSFGIARHNFAVALFYAQDFAGARREATAAAADLPDSLEPQYLLGLVARAENRVEDAVDAFSAVLNVDAEDVGANINMGQIYLEEQDYDSAIGLLRVAYAEEPFNVTAAYNLGLALVRSGEIEQGQPLLEEAQALRTTNYAVTYAPGYLNEGRYASAIVSTGAEPELVDADTSTATFSDVSVMTLPLQAELSETPFGRSFSVDELTGDGSRLLASGLGGGVVPIDFDADGDLDLFVATATVQELIRNDGGAGWNVVTSETGLEWMPTSGVPIGAVVADYNNDQMSDLFVLRYGSSSLYQNVGSQFVDVTDDAGFPPYPYLPGAAAFADVDHDGDVDLLVAGLADVDATRERPSGLGGVFPQDFEPAPLLLMRNNQDGTFTDVTRTAELGESFGHAVSIIPTDYDNRRDVDLLVVNYDGPSRLYRNQRDFTFSDVSDQVGINSATGMFSTTAAADLNKDTFPDFVFVGATEALFVLSDGRGGFASVEAPEILQGATALRIFDYDNDGLVDLFVSRQDGSRLVRNLGQEWSDVTDVATVAMGGVDRVVTGHGLTVADIDADGDSDVVSLGPGEVTLAQNNGDPTNASVRVTLQGVVSNRSGVGAKVQLRAGSLRARFDTSAATPAAAPADIVFGLGKRIGADVTRVIWPSGVLQAEVPASPSTESGAPMYLQSPLTVQELDREPSSCPLLYTWNGTRFEFVTDFLGAGEMGYWRGPGDIPSPDPVEYIRIRGDQLIPRDGLLEVRVTNELEEAVFLDRFELFAWAHPAGLEVYPNEGMTEPAKPHRVYAVNNLRVPIRAVEDDGTDVTNRIERMDRVYPDAFALKAIRGYAEPHTLTLDLGRLEKPSVLLLTGWTSYAFSSDNVAAHQAGLSLRPPILEAKTRQGLWRSVVDVGIPVGRPQTIAIDLSEHLMPGEHEIRISTNMRVYWDRILVGDRAPMDQVAEDVLLPMVAMLDHRGFSAELRPNNTLPTVYDYTRVTTVSPWKTMAGEYTRLGDVHRLIAAQDDQFVIARDGDELALSFDATELSPIPDGWVRTYFLKADGFTKEMDINSASPDSVGPLPFHAMSNYPYGADEQYPDTPEHRRYRQNYNTRTITRTVPELRTARGLP